MSDPLLAKADDFTTGFNPVGGETRALEIWLVIVLQNAGVLSLPLAQSLVRAISASPHTPGTLAARSLATGLRSEHYRSLLPADLSELTEEQLNTLDALRADFEATVAEFLAEAPAPPAPYPPDPPGGDTR